MQKTLGRFGPRFQILKELVSLIYCRDFCVMQSQIGEGLFPSENFEIIRNWLD